MMKKTIAILLALLMVLGMAVACSKQPTEQPQTETKPEATAEPQPEATAEPQPEAPKGLTDLNTYETKARELETWNIHYSQAAADLNVLCNLIDGLLTTTTTAT